MKTTWSYIDLQIYSTVMIEYAHTEMEILDKAHQVHTPVNVDIVVYNLKSC